MKKMRFIVSALACGLILTGCGGSGSSGESGGKIRKNDYLGNLPALYANYNAEKAATEKKIEEQGNKLMAGGEKNAGKLQKLFDDQKAKEKELKTKFDAEVKAELEKVIGKDIPVAFSEQLKSSDKFFFDVPVVKIAEQRGEPRLSISLTAKDNFTVPSMKGYDYSVYFRLAGKDGAPLERSASVILPVTLDRAALPYVKGETLIDSYVAYGFNLGNYPDRATLTAVEFISKEEYDASK